ncbi:unnamed protein product [Penicillium pancosmium]
MSPPEEASQVNQSQQPWKYLGYRAFCGWSASDKNLFILRSFKTLNTRILLKMQDEICQLEEELDGIDKIYAQESMTPVNNGSFRHDVVERRQEILTEAGEKLKQYTH